MISLSLETKDTGHVEEYLKENIPIVLFDRVSDKVKAPKVITDDHESAFLATKHLIDNGCRRIAFLSFSKHLYIIKQRLNGYRHAFLNSGLRPDAGLIIHCGNSEEKNQELIMELLRENRPDAVFASVEKLMIPCYDVCKKLNIKIPAEVKLIGYSNSQMAEYLNPPLSAIVQPAYEIGREAAKLLFNLINRKLKNFPNENSVLPSKVHVRNSTFIMNA